jgi:hypothetical protein
LRKLEPTGDTGEYDYSQSGYTNALSIMSPLSLANTNNSNKFFYANNTAKTEKKFNLNDNEESSTRPPPIPFKAQTHNSNKFQKKKLFDSDLQDSSEVMIPAPSILLGPDKK